MSPRFATPKEGDGIVYEGFPFHVVQATLAGKIYGDDMARENALPWSTLEDVFARACAFLDPILSGQDGSWDPTAWAWLPRPT